MVVHYTLFQYLYNIVDDFLFLSDMSETLLQKTRLLTNCLKSGASTELTIERILPQLCHVFAADHAWVLQTDIDNTVPLTFTYQFWADQESRAQKEGIALLDSDRLKGMVVNSQSEVLKESVYSENVDGDHLYSVLWTGDDGNWLVGIDRFATTALFTDEENELFAAITSLVGQFCQAPASKHIDEVYEALDDFSLESQPHTEQRFKSLFNSSGISQWRLDVSKLKAKCAELRHLELSDLDEYIEAEIKLQETGLSLIDILEVNQATLDLFEAENYGALRGQLAKIFQHKSNRFILALLSELLQDGTHFKIEVEARSLKGQEIYAIVSLDILSEPDANFASMVVADISLQKDSELRLFESMEKYKLLMTTANDAIVIIDVDAGIIQEVNSRALELFNTAKEDLLGRSHGHLFPDEEHQRYIDFFKQQVVSPDQGTTLDSFVEARGQEKIPVEISISSATIGQRQVAQVLFHNLSNRFKLEERRRLLATAVEQAAESVLITDTKGNVEYVNPAFEEVSGYSFTDIIGKKPSILSSGETPRFQYKYMWNEISKGKIWRGTFINRKVDGSLYKEEATITPVRDRRGSISNYVAVKRDITKQTALENQIRQSQKMQAIGTLAGGVAHDFNNILTAILGYAELSQVYCEKPSLLYDNLSEIISASERAANLIDQILKFSRQTEKDVTALRIDLIIKEVLKLLRASMPANIEIIADIASSALVKADPTQMHQVIMNLSTNAFHALSGKKGGYIKISLTRVELSPQEGVEIGNLSHGTYLCIQVEDNGSGIPAEFLPRIFEPYFSTKDKQEGTGLGLSVVHGIVNDHGGAVNVKSTPGSGSTFSVYLPETMQEESEGREREEGVVTGKGRILLVDDEEAIVDFLEQVLEYIGFEVESFTSSVDALEAFKKEPESFDLTLTDMGMPEMTGLELFEKIKEINPNLPTVLCTGHSEEVTGETYQEFGLSGFIAKPFNVEELAQEVNRIINANSSG